MVSGIPVFGGWWRKVEVAGFLALSQCQGLSVPEPCWSLRQKKKMCVPIYMFLCILKVFFPHPPEVHFGITIAVLVLKPKTSIKLNLGETGWLSWRNM